MLPTLADCQKQFQSPLNTHSAYYRTEGMHQVTSPSFNLLLSIPPDPLPPPNLQLRLSGLSPVYAVMACQKMLLRGSRDDKISSDQT